MCGGDDGGDGAVVAMAMAVVAEGQWWRTSGGNRENALRGCFCAVLWRCIEAQFLWRRRRDVDISGMKKAAPVGGGKWRSMPGAGGRSMTLERGGEGRG